MKKIFKQLSKLYPTKHIVLEHLMRVYRHGYSRDTEEVIYRFYVEDSMMYPNSWSPDFKTLKELDIELASKIEGYKRVYKDKEK